MRAFAWSMVAACICGLVLGCRQPDPEGHMRAKSRTTLFSVCKLVYLAESNTKEPPPVRLPELVGWLSKHASAEEPYIDYKQNTIRDAWGHPLVIVRESGKFIGVGSPGPDARWQDGNGDDIIVSLQEVKQ